MSAQTTGVSSKEHILKAFQALRSEYQQAASAIKTKQEAAERETDKRIVETASTYTVESIVKGLADLQLDFGKSTEGLIAKLAREAPKLSELRRAIRVETQHLSTLHNIRVAADALDILVQEHQEIMKRLEEQNRQQRETLEREIHETRQAWQKEQEDFETALQARQTLVKKERQRQETDYQYELERKRTMEADEYAARKSALERQLAEENAKREADWTERERALADLQEMLERYRTLTASYSQELQNTTEKARQEAIAEEQEEARVQAELFEKEQAAAKNIHELHIASLKETIDQQANHIEHLSTQLQAALKQVQDLAAKAVTTNA